MRKTIARCVFGAFVAMLPFSVVSADTFPSKPIKLIVPFGVGGAGDQLARALSKAITDKTGINVVVENKIGASGSIGAAYVARAPADGYTVLLGTNTTQVANRYLTKSLPYDPEKDFDPVTAISRGDQLLLIKPTLGVKDMQGLIDKAKAEPGKLSYGSGSSSSHVATTMLERAAGIQLLHVPYKSNSLAVTDLLGGQLDMMITDTATGLAHANSGKLVALAVTGSKRAPEAPHLPTIGEALGQDFSAMPWFNALYVPKGTPQDVVAKLNQLFRDATTSPEATNFYKSTAAERFVTTPEELAAFQEDQDRKWKAAIEAAGIEPV